MKFIFLILLILSGCQTTRAPYYCLDDCVDSVNEELCRELCDLEKKSK